MFVVSRVADSAVVTEVEMWKERAGVRLECGDRARAVAAGRNRRRAGYRLDGAALLISITRASSLDKIKSALIEAGASVRSTASSAATQPAIPWPPAAHRVRKPI